MKIKMLLTVVVRGHPGAKAGDVIDVTLPGLAGELIGLGLGEVVTETKAAPATVQTREPVVETRDPETPPVQSVKPLRSKKSLP